MPSNLRKVARTAIFFGIASLLILAPGVIDPSKAVAAPGQKELIEGAKKEGTMVLYASMSVKDMAKLLSKFKEKYPFLETKHVRASGTRMLSKILMEAKAKKYIPDVY